MKLVVLDAAAAELNAAAEWYEQQQTGLGDDLLLEAGRVLATIAERPLAFPLAPNSSIVRRSQFKRFPYAAYFVIAKERVSVMAFGHARRQPGYWRSRLPH